MSRADFSPAVASRRHEPPDSLDFFPTPPWATRAFLDVAAPRLGFHQLDTVWEPACGEGHMAAVLKERFPLCWASDLFDYGYGAVLDFLDETKGGGHPCDWIITNPPFNGAEAFARRALTIARRGVCLLVRTQWLHGVGRWAMFDRCRPYLVLPYAERVPMHRGRWVADGSTATDYVWVCWLQGLAQDRDTVPQLVWIPPGQRKAQHRVDDAMRFAAAAPVPLLQPERTFADLVA